MAPPSYSSTELLSYATASSVAMASWALHSIVTREGYVSQSSAPCSSVPSDHAMLEQFTEFLENRLQTENMGMLRRIFADFLMDHEHTLLAFLELAAIIIVIKPFDQHSARRRSRAAALLNMPKRPLNERGCVFFYLANRVHTRNMALLKMIFLEFLVHDESLIEQFVARGDAVISVIPCRLEGQAPPVPRGAPQDKAPEQAAAAPVDTTTMLQALSTVGEATEVAVEQEDAGVEKVSPLHKSPSLGSVEVSSSPRSPTNSGASKIQDPTPVQQPESEPGVSPVVRVDTTEASTRSEDLSQEPRQQEHRQQGHRQQELHQQEPQQQGSPQQELRQQEVQHQGPQQEKAQQEKPRQQNPRQLEPRTRGSEQQEPPPRYASRASPNSKRRRVGWPKVIAIAPEAKPAARQEVKSAARLDVNPTATPEVKPTVAPEAKPAAGSEVKAAATPNAKAALEATILKVKPAVSDAQQPSKRKPGRPRKSKIEIAGAESGAALTGRQPSAGTKKKRRRGTSHVLRVPVRAPGKRKVRQPGSFSMEQAVEVLSAKRPRCQHDGEHDAADAPVKAADPNDAPTRLEQQSVISSEEKVHGSAEATSRLNGEE